MKSLALLFAPIAAVTTVTICFSAPRPEYPPARQIWLAQPPGLAAVQQQQEPPRHDKYRDDPHAYCMAAEPLPSQSEHGAHECHCHLNCETTADGSRIRVDTDPACELYCTQSRCACYPDDPCSTPEVQRH